jgi:hypothetical protein
VSGGLIVAAYAQVSTHARRAQTCRSLRCPEKGSARQAATSRGRRRGLNGRSTARATRGGIRCPPASHPQRVAGVTHSCSGRSGIVGEPARQRHASGRRGVRCFVALPVTAVVGSAI